VELNDKSFIELLRKSESFVISEAFAKVKNAKVLAVYADTKSVLFQNPVDKKLYYSNYKLTEDDITLDSIERIHFEKRDYKSVMKENIANLFSKEYDKNIKNLSKSIREVILDNDEPEMIVDKRIRELTESPHVPFVKKPSFEIKDPSKLKEGLNKLREDKYFGKFLTEAENSNKIPFVSEEIDWSKDTARIFQRSYNPSKHEKIREGYTLRGFKKSQILAKGFWKADGFRKNLTKLVEGKTSPKVFCDFYQNLTLLSEDERNELFTKTLLAISSNNKIDDKLKKITDAINENKNRMLSWDLLNEGAPALPTTPPEATDVAAPAPGIDAPPTAPEAGAPTDVTPDELPAAEEPVDETGELGSEEELATEATEEVKIINALLEVIEDVFWNGNQENNELANIIKEIRDMRAAGSFDEDRLVEIFKDLFSVTQQIATSTEEESGAGEELPAEEVEAETTEETPEAGIEAGNAAPVGGEEEESPLETYM